MRSYWSRDDAPNLTSGDFFGVSSFVSRLADLLTVSPKPLTVALSGSWGVGKTTVAEGLKRALSAGNVPFCLVDLWSEDVSRLRRTLVVEVGAALRVGEPQADARKRVAEQLDTALRLAKTTVHPPHVQFAPGKLIGIIREHKLETAAVMATLFLSFALIDQFAPALVGTFSSVLGALLTFVVVSSGLLVTVTASSETQSPTETVVETQRLFGEIVSQGSPEDSPVIVVVDNIDRLPPDDALIALREIRSLMEIRGSRCVFVVPVDRDALVQQLRRKLGSRKSARDYLDKFFNIDIALTDPSQVDLRDWARSLAESMLSGANLAAKDYREVAQVAVLGAGGSPRAVRRILNGVSTRLRLLEESDRARLGVRQIAFTEVLVDRFPGMATRLATTPRKFVDLRARFASDPSEVALDVRQWAGDQESGDALGRFLGGTAEIPLSDIDLQALLSLRSDRFWRGVGDATRIQPALEAGESVVLREVVEGLDGAGRAVAIERALEWIRKSQGEEYTLFAFNGLNAVAPSIDLVPDKTDEVRLVAIELAEGGSELEVASRLSNMTAQILLAPLPVEPRISAIWRRLALLVSKGTEEAVLLNAVTLLRTTVAHASLRERRALQATLAPQSPAIHGPLFELPVEQTLVDREVGSRYAADLARLELTPEGAMASRGAAERFALASAAGWSVLAESESVLTRLAQQVPTLSSIGEEQRLVVEKIVEATSAIAGAQADALVTALATWGGAERHMTLNWALQYESSANVSQTLKSQIEAWLATADPNAVSAFVTSSAALALKRGIAGGPALARRWFEGEDTLLENAYDFDAAPGTALQAVLEAGPTTLVLTRLPSAARVFKRRRPDQLPDISTLLRTHLASLPAELATSAASTAETLASEGWQIGPSAPGFLERVANATLADLEGLYPLGEALVRLSVESGPSLVSGYVNRCAIVGAVPLASLAWCSRAADASMRPSLLGALSSAIRAGLYGVPELIAAVGQARQSLQTSSAIRAALAACAALPATSCSHAAMLLAEAEAWSECWGDQLIEFNQMLAAVADRCPEATSAVLSLRRVQPGPEDVKSDPTQSS